MVQLSKSEIISDQSVNFKQSSQQKIILERYASKKFKQSKLDKIQA